MDQNSSCNLDVDDFRWGLMDFGVQISKDEASEVLASFDTGSKGTVDYEAFLASFKVSSFYFEF